MKKTIMFPYLLAIAGLALCTAGLAADQPETAVPLKPITKKLTFIYIPKLVHPWYEEVKRGVEYAIQEVKKEGIDVEYIWDAPAQADVDEENKKIEAAISRKPDGLCVSCLDPATNAQMLDEALKAGLNVLTFNASGGPKYPFVGRNKDADDGYICGKYVAEKLGKKGKVAILLGSLTSPEHQGRVTGFKKAIAECPNMKIVFEQPDNDNLEQAVSVTESALQANPDLNAILCCNASNPIGAARAVKNAGLTGKIVIGGFDNLPETLEFVKDGTIACTMAQRQWEIGYWTLKYLVAMNRGQTIPQDHDTGALIVTTESLNKK